MSAGSARRLACASGIAVMALTGVTSTPSARSAMGDQASSTPAPLLAEQAFKTFKRSKEFLRPTSWARWAS